MGDVQENRTPDLDLGTAAIRYLRLLTKIHLRRQKDGHHSNEDPIYHAIYRYENCWLPLLSEYTGTAILKPPWDVYYVWCLHVLTSANYREYCRRKYGRLLDHQFEDDAKKEDLARERAKEMWESRFPEEMFEANPNGSITEPNSELNKTIVDSERKQMTFYYQVSLSHFKDDRFIKDAVDRYRKLLVLKQEHPTADLCPTHDLEVIRQAHILHPQKYEIDLERILGEVIEFKTMEHAFSEVQTYDIEEKSAIETTRRLWSAKYKTTYDVAGIRHRGLREESRFVQATQTHLRQSEPENIIVTLDQIKIADLWSRDHKIAIEARKLGKTSYTYDVLFRVSGRSGNSISTKNTGSQRFSFNLRDNRAIELHTFGTKGRFCMKREEHVATTFFDPRKLYEDGEKMMNKELLVEVPRISYGDPTVSFQCKVDVVNKAKPHVFTLYREPFVPGPIPKDLKPFIKLASWSDVHTFDMDTVNSARHSVRTPGGWGTNFVCHVVSCRDLDLGGVLLYEDGTELVTAAHTIGDDQLPLPTQVSPSYTMSLDRISGQHAMLIRNQYGDWGLCIMKRHPELDGVVAINFENLQEDYTRETTFTFEQSTTVSLDEMSVDLVTGQVTLEANCAEAAEYVTLGYVIGVLYVFTSGHQAPEVMRQASRDGLGDPVGVEVPSGTVAGKIKSKANVKRYDISSRSTSTKGNSMVTLSNLKSRRKKKTVVCTMLLACGLQANMMVEEDLTRMSFHSEVSLLGPSQTEVDVSPRGMDEVHRQSFYTQVRQDAQELHQRQEASHLNGFLSPSNDQFTFRKADNIKDQNHASGKESRTSIVLRDEIPPSTLTPRQSVRESWAAQTDDEPLYDSADFAATPEHLENRARLIIDQVMANAITDVGSATSNSKFISEGDELPPNFASTGRVPQDAESTSSGAVSFTYDSDSYMDSDSDDESFTYTVNDIAEDLEKGINPGYMEDAVDTEYPVQQIKSALNVNPATGHQEDTKL